MNIDFSGSLQIERVEGKFVSKDEIIEIVQGAFESLESEVASSLTGLGADGTSKDEITDISYEVS